VIVRPEKDESCAACGEVVAAGTRATWQQAPPAGRLTHRVCPGSCAGVVPAALGPVVWDTVELVELSAFPPDEPIPLELTPDARLALAWA
jgi:hypothetical protein